MFDAMVGSEWNVGWNHSYKSCGWSDCVPPVSLRLPLLTSLASMRGRFVSTLCSMLLEKLCLEYDHSPVGEERGRGRGRGRERARERVYYCIRV